MPNLAKVQVVFNDLLEQFNGAEQARLTHVAGQQYIENKNITKQRVAAFKKRFEDALSEADPE